MFLLSRAQTTVHDQGGPPEGILDRVLPQVTLVHKSTLVQQLIPHVIPAAHMRNKLLGHCDAVPVDLCMIGSPLRAWRPPLTAPRL